MLQSKEQIQQGISLNPFTTTFMLVLFSLILSSSCTQSKNESDSVRLAYLQTDLHHLPAFVALEKGLYAQEGLSVEVAGIFKAGPELMSGFAAGSLDAGYVGLAPATVAVANNTVQAKVISQINKNGSALVVKRGSPYQDITGLKGKVIAIPGHATIQDFLVRRALSDSHIKDNLTTIITIKPPEMINALALNTIDAFIAWEPYPSMALTKELGQVLMYSRDIWWDHPCCVLVVSDQLVKHSPYKVQSLLKAHLKSIDYIEHNLNDAVSIGAKYTGMDKKTIERALHNIQFDHQLRSNQVVEYMRFLNELGYTSIADPPAFVKSLLVTDEE